MRTQCHLSQLSSVVKTVHNGHVLATSAPKIDSVDLVE